MSVLDYFFQKTSISQSTPEVSNTITTATIQSSIPEPVTKLSNGITTGASNSRMNQDIQRDAMIKKYNYDFKLSPMQNAYLEMNARFNGNWQDRKIKDIIDNYLDCVKNFDKFPSECLGIANGIDRASYDYRDLSCPLYLINTSDNSRECDSIKPIHGSRDKLKSAQTKLEKACPTYYLVQDDAKRSETCYLMALEYWKVKTTNYLDSLKNGDKDKFRSSVILPTSFDRTERSDILRKNYFNDNSFEYPKNDDLK
jgi:hypothetical protein